MKALILAGGLGTRMRQETEFRPKPMVEIGARPILWHIMKHLSFYGINEFVIALGYKGDLIREYFQNFHFRGGDFTVDLGTGDYSFYGPVSEENWKISLVETGLFTPTGGRIHKARRYLSGSEPFLCTYGDGLSNLNIDLLRGFHEICGKVATVTASRPISRFGKLSIGENNRVLSFQEKTKEDSYVNSGFFIFNQEIFDYLTPESTLEGEPLEKLSEQGELFAFRHDGFWQPMDTIREMEQLNTLWSEGRAPWKVWEG